MDQAEVRFRVRYAETDQMGVVYHANYLAWMEMARTELCRVRGIRYRDIEREDGVSLAVVEVNCRYRAPALYDDLIAARGRLADSNARIVTFAYEIVNAETGKLLVTAETRHVFLDRQGKPIRVPARLKTLFRIGE
ncbi:MAG: acyl-CoA thioesterase [Bryobacter sp.]|jgi:acyl-CoA thioester hydrolase|nr:acyl-CoA thioesterase [Bryobacter sp.]